MCGLCILQNKRDPLSGHLLVHVYYYLHLLRVAAMMAREVFIKVMMGWEMEEDELMDGGCQCCFEERDLARAKEGRMVQTLSHPANRVT